MAPGDPGEAARPTTAHCNEARTGSASVFDRQTPPTPTENASRSAARWDNGHRCHKCHDQPQQGTHAAPCGLLCRNNGITKYAIIQSSRGPFSHSCVLDLSRSGTSISAPTPTLKLHFLYAASTGLPFPANSLPPTRWGLGKAAPPPPLASNLRSAVRCLAAVAAVRKSGCCRL